MRPCSEGLKYFPHDVDASSDEKIETLRSLYGNDGYAFYFILLEKIYKTNNCEIDISDIETRKMLAKKIDVSLEKFESMLDTALKKNCFDIEDYNKRGVLTSNGIKKRVQAIINKRIKMREKYREKRSLSKSDSVSSPQCSSEYDKVDSEGQGVSDMDGVIKKISNLLASSLKKIKKDVIVNIVDCENVVSDMILLDKRNPSTIEDVIEWVRKDKFWRKVVVSPDVLRKNFDKIEASMSSDASSWVKEG